jgi:hypothetical protein
VAILALHDQDALLAVRAPDHLDDAVGHSFPLTTDCATFDPCQLYPGHPRLSRR